METKPWMVEMYNFININKTKNMLKKIILMLFWLGFISINVLRANDIETKNLKVESTLVSEKEVSFNAEFLFYQDDSTLVNSMKATDTVNLPFGKSSRKLSPGAITVITPEELLMFDSFTSVAEAISGRVPGIIGGTNIHGLGDALVVIDGIPRPIGTVSIEEVAQITIIKDANAAALYGVQGRNGIILITSKRGKPNVRKVTVNVSKGISRPVRLPKYLGSADYMELYNEARANDGLAAQYTQVQIDGTRAGTKPAVYPDVDYYNSDFMKTAKQSMRAVIDFSGGNKNAQYYLNAGYSHAGTLMNIGQAKDDQDNRINIRSNVNFRINNFITSYLDIVVVFDIIKRANGDYWSDASTLLPNLYPPLIDTALILNKNYKKTAQLIDGRYMLGGKTGYLNNVWGNLNLSGYYNQFNSSVQFNNGINVDLNGITKGLNLKTFYAIDFYSQFSETQTNTYAVYSPVYGGTNMEDILSVTKIGTDQLTGTQGVGSSSLARNFGAYIMLDYNRIFREKHALWASLLTYGELYMQSGLAQKDKNAHMGGRINYSYDNKYIIDFSSTLTNSAKLPKGNRVGFSPSVGVSWIVSEESFLKNNSIVDYLKLKVSASKMNTDLSIGGYYYYEGQYVGGNGYNWNEVRAASSTAYSIVKNDKLFYEVRNNINLGAEAVLFKKSLIIDANLFQERITNIITQMVNHVPSFLGGFYAYENNGENKYTGAELGATWRKLVTNDFSFDIGANMTFLKTKVVKRDELYAYDYLYRAGKPTSVIFGLEALGLFKDAQDITDSPSQTFGTVKPGDIKYKDQNGDNTINAQDQVMIGDYTPHFVGALNLTLRYKNISLFGLATLTRDYQSYLSNPYYWVNSALKYSEFVLDRWTTATAETATYPRLTSQANPNNYQSSDFWLYDQSRISISRLQLSYALPKALTSKLAMKNLSLYARASNVVTFAKDLSILQLNIGSEPQYRYYALGLKAEF
jgi:TonB-linked SusC/RagA family outer membrane protein